MPTFRMRPSKTRFLTMIMFLLTSTYMLATATRFIFVVNSDDNTISQFAFDSTLGQARENGYALAGVKPAGIKLVLGKFAYVVNSSSNSLYGYSMDPATGSLTRISGTFATGSSPQGISGVGAFVYVANHGSNTVSAYKANSSTGALTSISGSPFLVGNGPQAISVDPTGQFLFVANESAHDVTVFRISASTGALQHVTGSPFTTGLNPSSISSDPAGHFAFVTNAGSNTVSVFKVNSTTGALTTVAGSPFHTGAGPAASTTDNSGKYLYVGNTGGSSISAFKLNASTGALTNVGGSPFSTGANPVLLRTDGTGSYLLVGRGASREVAAWHINSVTGALALVRRVRSRGIPVAIALFNTTNPTVFAPRNMYAGGGQVDSTCCGGLRPSTIDSSGTPATSGPIVSTVNYPGHISTDLRGRFLVAVEYNCCTFPGPGDVISFRISSTGTLTNRTSAPGVTSGEWGSVMFESSGRWVYAADKKVGGIRAFSVSSSGALAQLGGSPFPVSGIFDLAVDPTGRFVFATLTSGGVKVFKINPSSGTLTLISGSPFASGSGASGTITVDPTGKFLWVSGTDASSIYGFNISAISGSLSALAGSPFTASTFFIQSMLADPTGRALVTEPSGSFAINVNTGALTARSADSGPDVPGGVTIDPSGRYAYLGEWDGGAIYGYSIASDGSLVDLGLFDNCGASHCEAMSFTSKYH